MCGSSPSTSGVAGNVNQTGGAVTISDHLRIAHWGNHVSTYNLSGGTLSLTNTNPGASPAGGGEQSGGVYVGVDARIGDDTLLSANVSVMERCLIGARCLVHPSAVIGADGFGFALDISVPEHVKIPQAGVVRIDDDVEIGAGSCVDRATTCTAGVCGLQ
jgi:UDP-3-O-[3-hydroxymyristoyl] glucosamine N-acyltransferase